MTTATTAQTELARNLAQQETLTVQMATITWDDGKQMAEQLYPIARQKLEQEAVALEDAMDSAGTPVTLQDNPEFRMLQLLSTTTNMMQCFRKAVTAGDAGVVSLCLTHPAVNPGAPDQFKNPQWAISFAVERGSIGVVERLLQDGSGRVNPSVSDNFCLNRAILRNYPEIVDLLLQEGACRVDPSMNNGAALLLACEYGNVRIVDRLLQDGRVDPRCSDDRPFEIACSRGHLAVVERLLQDARVDPTECQNYPIYLAIIRM